MFTKRLFQVKVEMGFKATDLTYGSSEGSPRPFLSTGRVPSHDLTSTCEPSEGLDTHLPLVHHWQVDNNLRAE